MCVYLVCTDETISLALREQQVRLYSCMLDFEFGFDLA